jgi:subtilisin family serine protease
MPEERMDQRGSENAHYPLTVIALLRKSEGRQPLGSSTRSSGFAALLKQGRVSPIFAPPRSVHSKGAPPPAPTEELSRFFAVRAKTEAEARELLEELQADEAVADAYVAPPRHLYASRRHGATPGGMGGPNMKFDRWDLEMIGFLSAEAAGLIPDASNVVIAVLDSGVDAQHPDLKDAVEALDFSPGGTAGTGEDAMGHGTHVIGITAGRGREPSGMRGMCNAKVLSIKAMDPYDSVRYFQALREAADRAHVINLSLGGPADPLEETIIKWAMKERGVTIVAAMGNEFDYGNPTTYPAAIDGVIAVGAVDKNGVRADFSCCGPHTQFVGPGVDIVSTLPVAGCSQVPGTATYGAMSGTSMAAPYVTATVALLKAKSPALTPSEIAAALKTKLLPAMQGLPEEYGRGLLDVEATLR